MIKLSSKGLKVVWKIIVKKRGKWSESFLLKIPILSWLICKTLWYLHPKVKRWRMQVEELTKRIMKYTYHSNHNSSKTTGMKFWLWQQKQHLVRQNGTNVWGILLSLRVISSVIDGGGLSCEGFWSSSGLQLRTSGIH